MKPKVPKQRPTVPLWLVSLAAAVLLLIIPFPAWFVERFYSRNFFPTVQVIVTTITNAVPFAVTDLLLLGALLWVILSIFRFLRLRRSAGFFTAVTVTVRRLIRLLAIVAIVFMMFWGFNYRRVPLDTALHGDARVQLTPDDLKLAIGDANALAGRLRMTLPAELPEYDALSKTLVDPFNAALRQLGRPELGQPGRPKYSLLLTPFFTSAGVDGMIDPLALETIVHPELLPFERPFILAHEWSHLAGQADEAEASAIGWLACMQGDPTFAYSASVYLILEAGSQLPSSDWHVIAAKLDPGVSADISAVGLRLQKQKPVIRAASSRVYNSYLRANRVDDGVRSYSRALSLILTSPMRDAISGYQRK